MSDMRLIIRAAAFAVEKHRNQRRKDAEASFYDAPAAAGFAPLLSCSGTVRL
jgi:hypothetical protein